MDGWEVLDERDADFCAGWSRFASLDASTRRRRATRRSSGSVRRADRRRCAGRIGFPAARRNGSRRFFHAALARGVYLPPSPYEVCFLSLAHDDATLAHGGRRARRRRARGGRAVTMNAHDVAYVVAASWMVFTVSLASWWLAFGLSRAQLGDARRPDAAQSAASRGCSCAKAPRSSACSSPAAWRCSSRSGASSAGAATRNVLHVVHARSEDIAGDVAAAGRGAARRLAARRRRIRTCNACCRTRSGSRSSSRIAVSWPTGRRRVRRSGSTCRARRLPARGLAGTHVDLTGDAPRRADRRASTRDPQSAAERGRAWRRARVTVDVQPLDIGRVSRSS